MFSQIINNAAFLVTLSLLYGLLYSYFNGRTLADQLIHGALFGSLSVAVMLVPITFSHGIIFDTRPVVLSLAGLYGGPVAAGLAVLMASIYRVFFVGGVGTLPAVVMHLATAGLGVAFYYYLRQRNRDGNIVDLALLGVGANVLLCLCMLLLPWPMGLKVMFKMAPPVLIVLPAATVLTALAMSVQVKMVRAENQLRESEAKYRSMMEAFSDPICAYNPDYTISYMNPAMQALLGRNAEGETCYKALYNREQPCEECAMPAVLGGNRITKEALLTVSERHFLAAHFPIRHADGKISKMSIFRDINGLKKAQQALKDSEARFRALFEEAGDAIFVCDDSGRLVEVNAQACASLGYSREELLTMNVSDISAEDKKPEMMHGVWDSIPEGRTVLLESVHLRKDGGSFPVEMRLGAFKLGGKQRILGLARDISERRKAETEKKQLEARLAQSQKMEAIGTLAGGIAHDFNNILGSIIGYTELAQLDMVEDPEKVKDYLEQILAGGMRARNLVRQILAFSRQSDHEKRAIELKPIIKEVLAMLQSSLPTTIEIKSEISVNGGYVLADPTSMHQVLMNLCTNAADAMEVGGGKLDISLCEAMVASGDHAGGMSLAPGHYHKIIVSDTGHGIPAEVRGKIFEPFFTTKEPGKGTGMGLSTVHGIVKEHGGAIAVYSEPGKGTTFNLLLPVIHQKPQAELQADRAEIRGGRERILFVDDEQALVDIGHRMLSNLGYVVTPCNSSVEALDILRANPQAYDMLITDMTMPKMTGLDLAADAHDIRPDLPILILTGFSKQLSLEKASRYGVRKLIAKPVLRRRLAADIRQVLDEA